MRAARKRVVAVVFEDAQILDFTGPLEVFATANREVTDAVYEITVCSVAGGFVRTSSGMAVDTVALSAVRGSVDTLLIAGGLGTATALGDPTLLLGIARLAARARRVASVCSGAFLLATTGMLDGKRATTHWQWCDQLARIHPDIDVDPDPIFVRNGNVWTSAGVTCGIDLALAMLDDDHGAAAASIVARQLVVYVQRAGGQSQFSAHLVGSHTTAMESRDYAALLGWIESHLDADLSVGALARRANQSPRHFARRFKDDVGNTPGDHVEGLRLESARKLLETTTFSLAAVAERCGFGTPETMHRSFRRRLNTTPGEHRRHFSRPTRGHLDFRRA
jgi:transcriptional regulator GlxA family with amidase domain